MARDTRELILRNAIRIFAREGFAGATFQAIADACGLTQPAAFHYFKNKEELILASIEAMAQGNYATVSGLMRPEDGAYDRLYKHCLGNLLWALDRREDASLLLLLYYLAAINPKFSTVYTDLLARARLRMREHLLAGQRERVFVFQEMPEVMAARFHDLLLGSFVNILTTSRKAKPKELSTLLEQASEEWNARIRSQLAYAGPSLGTAAIKIP
jgi:AcrR family transcriptional regulator